MVVAREGTTDQIAISISQSLLIKAQTMGMHGQRGFIGARLLKKILTSLFLLKFTLNGSMKKIPWIEWDRAWREMGSKYIRKPSRYIRFDDVCSSRFVSIWARRSVPATSEIGRIAVDYPTYICANLNLHAALAPAPRPNALLVPIDANFLRAM